MTRQLALIGNPADAAGLGGHFGNGLRNSVWEQNPIALICTTVSDSHTWNLVFLNMLLEELGFDVINEGPCTPVSLVVDDCEERTADVVVVSTVNGHGMEDSCQLIRSLRARSVLAEVPVVIGGKLNTLDGVNQTEKQRLLECGFNRVFDDSDDLAEFIRYSRSLRSQSRRAGALRTRHPAV